MKKLYFLIAVFLVASAVFAQENYRDELGIERFNMEVNVGFPVHWTNGVHNDTVNDGNKYEDKFATADTAIGLAGTYNINRNIGITLDMDFFFGAKLTGFSSPTSNYISLSGLNVFVGPVFYLYNNGALRIPFTAGLHFYYFGDDLWIPELDGSGGSWTNRHEFQFGPEVSLGIQYHFDNNVYIFSRTNAGIDFLRVHSMNLSDGSEYSKKFHRDLSLNWDVKPSIGIGMKFK